MKNTNDFKSFHYLENGEIQFSCFDTIKTTKILVPNSYIITYDRTYGNERVVLKIDEDKETTKNYVFKDKDKIDNLFKSFFNNEVSNKIEKLGFCHKCGVLFFGKEGTGKSSIMKQYWSQAIKNNNALVFHFIENDYYVDKCWEFIRDIRRVQDNPIIVVFDEIDNHIKNNEGYLKTVFDGNLSINNCIFLAATNYINEIPKAISERPSRFKYSIEISDMTDISNIKDVITFILEDSLNETEIEDLAKTLSGNSLDYIKQYCFDKLMGLNYHREKNNSKVGFKI